MKPRERVFLIATVVIVGLTLWFGLSDDSSSSGSGGSSSSSAALGSLKAAQSEFKTNIETLKQGKKIAADYKLIDYGVADPVKSGRPEQVLSNELSALLTDRLHAQNPRIGTGTFNKISGVDEYCYIDIDVDITGSYTEIMSLLADMGQKGLLIKAFKIYQRGRGESDEVDLSLSVSRLVKVDDRIRRRLQSAARRASM